MNVVLTGPWASVAAWASAITAVAALIVVIVRIIRALAKSFNELMQTLEEDNTKLRDALSATEASRTELADQLVRVHKEIAATVESNSALVIRLQAELDQYRQSNLRLADEVESLKKQVAQYVTINQALSEQLARFQPPAQ